jgi:signal transduction histidine kinase
LAKAEGSAHRPARSVDLDELVLGQARQLSRATSLRVDTTRVSGGQVTGRDTELARVVENLASNAARYAATTVTFTVQENASAVELTVADDGPGIAHEDATRAFERFATFDDARAGSGAGLGLSIVAAIVAAHQGTVRAEEAEGGGARFVVRLPLGNCSGNAVTRRAMTGSAGSPLSG